MAHGRSKAGILGRDPAYSNAEIGRFSNVLYWDGKQFSEKAAVRW